MLTLSTIRELLFDPAAQLFGVRMPHGRLSRGRKAVNGRRLRPSAAPALVQVLEDRTLLTAFLVDTIDDDAAASVATIREATGAMPAAIQATVDAFRADLGTLNPNDPVSLPDGRREINWDGAPDGVSDPNAFPGDFFNFTAAPRARGVEFTTPGTGFLLSATVASGTTTEFGTQNATYPTAFATFTAERLFTPVGSNITDVTFFLPGTTTPALVDGFGAVFTDVDLAGSSKLEFFDAAGNLIFSRDVLATSGDESLSFLGVSFNSAVVARVRITSGDAALGGNDVTQGGMSDIVVLDDFIFGEPQSMTDGFVSLREAITAANTNMPFGDAPAGSASGDTITFAPGLDGMTITLGGSQLTITDDLVISGGALDITIDGAGASRIFDVNSSETVSLRNLTLQNGNAGMEGGGAIRKAGTGSLQLSSMTVTGNTAAFGGGVELMAGSTGIGFSTISNNTTGPAGMGLAGNGGGIILSGTATANVDGSTISGNTASGSGGGLWNSATGILQVRANSFVTGNTASGDDPAQGGGGIFNNGGFLRVNDSSVSMNGATGLLGSGGGIFNNTNGRLLSLNATVEENTANRFGGGIEDNSGAGGEVTLTDLVLISNMATGGGSGPGNGGGLHVSGAGNTTFDGVITVQGNVAANEGGGLWNDTGTMTITGIFAAGVGSNAAGGTGGGGIFNNGGTVNLSDTFFGFNSADGADGDGGGIYNQGGIVNVSDIPGFSNDFANRDGGGIFNTAGGTVTLTNVALSSGMAGRNGGGIFNDVASTLIVTDSTIDEAMAANDGGGLYNVGTATLNNTFITDLLDSTSAEAADFWAASSATTGHLIFAYVDTQNSTTNDDSTLTVRDAGGSIIEFDDDDGPGVTSVVAGTVVPMGGNVFFEVRDFGAPGPITPYELYVSIVDPAAAQAETESNDTSGTANVITEETLIVGNLATPADVDFYSITVPAGGGTLVVMLDNDPEDDSNLTDSHLQVIDTDGMSVLSDTNGGDGNSTRPVTVPAGTYFIRVSDGSAGSDTSYRFVAQVVTPADLQNESEPNDNTATASPLSAGQFGQGNLDTLPPIPNPNPAALRGGGIFNTGNLEINGGGVSDVTAQSGGGLFNDDGTATLNGAAFANNTALANGGGILNQAGDVFLNAGTLLSQNTAVNGGGVANSGAARTFVDASTVSDNTAAEEGGGLWNSSTGLIIVRNGSSVDANMAHGDGADQGGGGIFNDGAGVGGPGGRLAIQSGSTISGNVADGDNGSGGGILSINGIVTVDDSTVSGNSANRAGGGIEMVTGTVELRNSALDGNMATGGGNGPGNGGGLHVTGLLGQVGYVRIFGGTVAGNTADREGGGLWNQAGNVMVVRQGAVVAGNTASGDAADDGGGGIFNNNGRLSVGEMAQILGNSADGLLGSGGGIFSLGSGVTIDNALIQGNTAIRAGGGIEVVNGEVVITNSQIDSNQALGGGMGAPGNGGGIHVSGMALTRVDLLNTSVTNNAAALEGGGLWHQIGSVMLVRAGSIVSGNVANGDAADDGGGGLFNNGGRVVINAATIDNNHAIGAAGSGGGLFTAGGVVTIENSTVSNNTAIRAGGGIEIVNGLLETKNMLLTTNHAVGGGMGAPGNGGGLHVSGTMLTRVTLIGGSVTGNTAALEGGGLWHQSGSIMVIRDGTTIDGNAANGNAADDGGGGIFNNGGRLAITSATISNNTAGGTEGAGGGILSLAPGGLTLDNSTVSGNIANGTGGGVDSRGNLIAANTTIANNRANADGVGGGLGGGLFNGGTATLNNTIVAGNLIGAGSTLNDLGGNNLQASSSNNLISDATSAGGVMHGINGNIVGNSGAGFLPLASILNPLANNGGPTLTHALAMGSLALNAGSNALAKDINGIFFTNDQRGFGFPRIVGGTVDIGAFEN